jgi:hypothetical protein
MTFSKNENAKEILLQIVASGMIVSDEILEQMFAIVAQNERNMEGDENTN